VNRRETKRKSEREREREKKKPKEVTCHSQQGEVRNFPNELEDENGNVVAIGSKRVKRESCWSMIGETHKE